MASAVEQLAKGSSWSAFTKAKDLKKRILFVLLALIIYRLGTYVPVPGIDPVEWAKNFESTSQGIMGMLNMFSGGSIERMAIFSLSIMPYISASIFMQIATHMSPKLEAIKKEGESGRVRINQYTRYLTVLLATVQAFGFAKGLESFGNAVVDPGLFFKVSTVITMVGGTIFLMWIGEQITQRGIGNGISLIIFAGIVAELPGAIAQTLDLSQQGTFSFLQLLTLFVMVIGVIVFIVFMERAQRKLTVQYPKRQVGNKMMSGQQNHMPLKINPAGVIPPIFASALLMLPMTIVGFAGADGGDFTATVAQYLQHGSIYYMILLGVLVAFFCFFYTSIVFNPEENADSLRKNGGFIPGIRPGKSTAEYLDYVVTRLTTIGAIYLVFICLLPEILISKYAMPFYFGGTSLLIVVTVTMDTVAQIHSHIVAHQYEGLMKKAKLRGRKK